jgi:hypothetical protein
MAGMSSDACDAMHEKVGHYPPRESLGDRERLSDEQWFARHGAAVPVDPADGPRFAKLIEPLELATLPVRRLEGVNRRRCYRAFRSNPEAFESMCADALRRGRRNPVGLLCRMVLDGDHHSYGVADKAGRLHLQVVKSKDVA